MSETKLSILCEVLRGLADDFHREANAARHQAREMRARGFADQVWCYNATAVAHERDEQRVRNLLAVWERAA